LELSTFDVKKLHSELSEAQEKSISTRKDVNDLGHQLEEVENSKLASTQGCSDLIVLQRFHGSNYVLQGVATRISEIENLLLPMRQKVEVLKQR
jgi:hypothetical protein